MVHCVQTLQSKHCSTCADGDGVVQAPPYIKANTIRAWMRRGEPSLSLVAGEHERAATTATTICKTCFPAKFRAGKTCYHHTTCSYYCANVANTPTTLDSPPDEKKPCNFCELASGLAMLRLATHQSECAPLRFWSDSNFVHVMRGLVWGCPAAGRSACASTASKQKAPPCPVCLAPRLAKESGEGGKSVHVHHESCYNYVEGPLASWWDSRVPHEICFRGCCKTACQKALSVRYGRFRRWCGVRRLLPNHASRQRRATTNSGERRNGDVSVFCKAHIIQHCIRALQPVLAGGKGHLLSGRRSNVSGVGGEAASTSADAAERQPAQRFGEISEPLHLHCLLLADAPKTPTCTRGMMIVLTGEQCAITLSTCLRKDYPHSRGLVDWLQQETRRDMWSNVPNIQCTPDIVYEVLPHTFTAGLFTAATSPTAPPPASELVVECKTEWPLQSAAGGYEPRLWLPRPGCTHKRRIPLPALLQLAVQTLARCAMRKSCSLEDGGAVFGVLSVLNVQCDNIGLHIIPADALIPLGLACIQIYLHFGSATKSQKRDTSKTRELLKRAGLYARHLTDIAKAHKLPNPSSKAWQKHLHNSVAFLPARH